MSAQIDSDSPEDSFAADMRTAANTLVSIAGKLDTERRQRTFREWTRNVLIVVALAIGVFGLLQAHSADQSRNARAISSCLQDQQSALTAIKAGDRHDAIEAETLAPLPHSPEVQRRVDTYLQKQHTNTVEQWRVRNCSSRGIRDYFSSPHGQYAYLSPPKLTQEPATKG